MSGFLSFVDNPVLEKPLWKAQIEPSLLRQEARMGFMADQILDACGPRTTQNSYLIVIDAACHQVNKANVLTIDQLEHST
jgi:hypothetical protein